MQAQTEFKHDARFEELDELSSYHLVNPEQDIRGATLYSSATGQEIGRVDDMLVDTDAELVKAIRLDDGRCCSVDDIRIDSARKVYYYDGTEAAAAAIATAGAVQLVEENLVVGTREVVDGAVQVSTDIVTETETETVTLRQENLNVETVDVNEQITAAEADALLQPQTIQATAISEEAVAGKTAEIVGEVRVGKDVDMVQETVAADVRRTVVDVNEDIDATATAVRADLDEDAYDNATMTNSDSLIDKTADAIDDAFDNTARAARNLTR